MKKDVRYESCCVINATPLICAKMGSPISKCSSWSDFRVISANRNWFPHFNLTTAEAPVPGSWMCSIVVAITLMILDSFRCLERLTSRAGIFTRTNSPLISWPAETRSWVSSNCSSVREYCSFSDLTRQDTIAAASG